jgi:hypothetical protein
METLQREQEKPDIDVAAPTELTGNVHVEFIQLRDFLGADEADKNVVTDIYKMIDGGRGLDITDILWGINNVESKIGTPPLGVSRIQHLYNYLMIEEQINGLRKKQMAYMHG